MSDDGLSIDEKRVYSDQAGTTTAFVATDVGLLRVAISGNAVGEFRLDRRDPVADLAISKNRLAIATDEDVFLARQPGDAGDTDSIDFEPTEFGPATAVDFGSRGLVAAGDGRIARFDAEWITIGSVRAVRGLDVDQGLLVARTGVHRMDGDHVGLSDAFDLAAGPTVATGDGIYRLGNGWMCEFDHPVRAVEIVDETGLAGGDELYERRGDEWIVVDVPTAERIAAVAIGPATYAVTETGTVVANDGSGWRTRSLGTPGVNAIAVLQ